MKIKSTSEREQALAKSRLIVDGAKAAGRGLTPDEQATVKGHLDAIDEWDARVAADGELLKSLDSLGGGDQTVSYDAMGRQVVSSKGGATLSAADRDAMGRLVKGVETKSPVAVRFESKAALAHSTVTGAGLPQGFDPTPQEVPASSLSFTELSGLFTRKVVQFPSQTYYTVSGVTGIAVTAEGAAKPEIAHAVEGKTVQLKKLAGHFRTTMEMNQDAKEIVAAVLRQAMLDMTRAENQEVLAAMNAAEGVQVATATAATVLDTLADVVGTYVSRNGFAPDYLVAAPSDLAAIRKTRDAAGRWLVDPFSDPTAGPMGLKVQAVPGMTPGTMFVGTQAAGTWYEHQSGLMVQQGFNGDDLITNHVTTVVEQRVAAVVNQPSLLTKITVAA